MSGAGEELEATAALMATAVMGCLLVIVPSSGVGLMTEQPSSDAFLTPRSRDV